MVDAVKRASASRVTAVIPYLGYSRQDKKEKGRAPIVGKLIASLLQRAGVDRVIVLDMHSPVVKGFWDIPVENISLEPAILRYIKRSIPPKLIKTMETMIYLCWIEKQRKLNEMKRKAFHFILLSIVFLSNTYHLLGMISCDIWMKTRE